MNKDTKIVTVESLRNWLTDQIDMEWSCIDDFELIDGKPYDFGRGKINAYEQMLKLLDWK